ncbi:adenylate/guanylate cyclase [Candidatus Puniceispirillum marinum IMCC1322]|uniref:Adenylate/guanylate cyclase n=1 Tax=Puniceispirillum marinum (strain IMCC1322) TaxID=488538 RepID=D5BT74_PUNMI|nr:adenylate/guanylate cyclase [Candidatus Puniceispirillum marinum IMCC1322]
MPVPAASAPFFAASFFNGAPFDDMPLSASRRAELFATSSCCASAFITVSFDKAVLPTRFVWARFVWARFVWARFVWARFVWARFVVARLVAVFLAATLTAGFFTAVFALTDLAVVFAPAFCLSCLLSVSLSIRLARAATVPDEDAFGLRLAALGDLRLPATGLVPALVFLALAFTVP